MYIIIIGLMLCYIPVSVKRNAPFMRALAMQLGSRRCHPAPDLVFSELNLPRALSLHVYIYIYIYIYIHTHYICIYALSIRRSVFITDTGITYHTDHGCQGPTPCPYLPVRHCPCHCHCPCRCRCPCHCHCRCRCRCRCRCTLSLSLSLSLSLLPLVLALLLALISQLLSLYHYLLRT